MSLKPETTNPADLAVKVPSDAVAAGQNEIPDTDLDQIAGGLSLMANVIPMPIDDGPPVVPLPGEKPELDDSRAWG